MPLVNNNKLIISETELVETLEKIYDALQIMKSARRKNVVFFNSESLYYYIDDLVTIKTKKRFYLKKSIDKIGEFIPLKATSFINLILSLKSIKEWNSLVETCCEIRGIKEEELEMDGD